MKNIKILLARIILVQVFCIASVYGVSMTFGKVQPTASDYYSINGKITLTVPDAAHVPDIKGMLKKIGASTEIVEKKAPASGATSFFDVVRETDLRTAQQFGKNVLYLVEYNMTPA